MRYSLQLFVLLLLTSPILSQRSVSKFDLIIRTKATLAGEVNQSAINKLTEPLKAIAAYYSAMEGSNCDGTNCELTTALGLGEQGSELHKNILKKWFKNDKLVQKLIEVDCNLPPSTSSNNSEFIYLTLELVGNEVIAKYKVSHYNHGKITFLTSTNDKFLIQGQNIIVKSLKL